MLDGVTAYNELRAAERAGVRGTALWRLGMEDPSIWSIWDATQPTMPRASKLGGNSSRLRPDPRRRRRHLAHHRHAAEAASARFDYDARLAIRSTMKAFQSYPLSWRIEQMGARPEKSR